MSVTSITTKLYGMDKKGGFKEWTIWTEGSEVVINHGKVGGKMQEKRYTCKPKNVGRANATTAEQQAILEMRSRINKQYDKCYRYTCEEASLVGSLLPMLASDYTRVGHRITYPCYVSKKLDGVRCIAVVDNGVVSFKSRGGKDYPVPAHLQYQISELSKITGQTAFDGELYIHGMKLQNIVSAVKKPNENTRKLEFHIFDLPIPNTPWTVRNDMLETIIVQKHGMLSHVSIVPNWKVRDELEARKIMNEFIEDGYEGLMLRNTYGMYEANHRSGDLQKWKLFQDMEAKVFDVEEDNLGEGVYWLRTPDDIEFKAKPRGTHESRLYSVLRANIGKWMNVCFQDFTTDNKPTFPVVTGERNCTDEGIPLD